MTTVLFVNGTLIGSSSPGDTISSTTVLTIGAAGIVEGASANPGILMTGSNDTVNVLGQVYGFVNGIFANVSGTSANSVLIGTTGTVVAMTGMGVDLFGGSDTVNNAGQILSSSDGIVVSGNLDNIVNSGTITDGYIGIDVAGSGSDVANSGTIDGWTGINFDATVTTGTDNVDNSGTINSAVRGASPPIDAGFGIRDMNGDTLYCTNSGHITGRVGVAFGGASGQTDTLANQGVIEGRTSYGVEETGGATSKLVNSGTISGHGTAILFGTGAGNVLDNNGTIQGDVTSTGTLTVANTGHIAGNVTFGTGNDSYDGSRGDVTGAVSGGDGNDVLTGGIGRDRLDGGNGSDVLSGGDGDDRLSATGTTATIDGGNGRDTINMGAAFNATDQIDGGSGNDIVTLGGNYSAGVILGHDTLANIERIVVTDGFSYNLTTDDDTVAAGATMRVDGSALTSTNTLTLDGSAETDGRFLLTGGAGADVLIGGAASDWLTGNGGANQFTGGLGADHIIASGSSEHFNYGEVAESTSVLHDAITGFNALGDVFDLDVAVSGIDTAVTSGALHKSAFDANLAFDIGSAQLAAGHGVVFTPASGNLAGHTFLIVDANGVAGYQAGQDYVFDLVSPSNLTSLSTSNFV